jgi:hypothetical protein
MRVPGWQVKPGHLLQVELAACYRVFASRGWAEEIFNHITLRMPGALRYPKKFRLCFGGKFATILLWSVESFWIPMSWFRLAWAVDLLIRWFGPVCWACVVH